MIYNSNERYGAIAKYLHWGTAVLFLFSYTTVYYRHWFTEKNTDENWLALQLHLSVGITIAVVVFLRIMWKTINTTPAQLSTSKLQRIAAHLGHYSLYAIMIIMPITGYIGTGVETEYFKLFNISKFEDTWLFTNIVQNKMNLTFEELEETADFIHKNILGEWLVWILILGHASAALYHHFIIKDNTLKRMTNE